MAGHFRQSVLLPLLWMACASAGLARDRILIVGSTTVYPFSVIVAEHFARSGPFPRPKVRAESTGEGFRLFCAGSGSGTPDVTNASRPITAAERAVCRRNGVGGIAEIRIGYDSLILANSVAASSFDVSLKQLWQAAAKVVPRGGRLIPNPYRRWSDIDPALPDRPIRLIGPAVGHGTRDAFIELVMEPSCRAALAGITMQASERDSACRAVRADGGWTDLDNLELALGKLASDHDAVAIITYSYIEQFHNRIHAATIGGTAPSRESISSGKYPLSRPLFIYVKEAHVRTTTGLADYAAEFLSFCAAGAHGYLADEGLVPLPPAELLQERTAVARLQR